VFVLRRVLLLNASEFFWQTVWEWPVLFLEILLHALEAELVSLVNFVNDDTLRHVAQEFGGIEFVVGPWSLDDLGLLLDGEIFVSICRVNVLFVQLQDFVVRNDTGIGKVVDSRQPCLCHCQRRWKHFRQYGHGVWNVDDAFVLYDFGDKTTVDEVIGDGHTNTQDQAVGELFEHGFHVPLGLTVKGPIKVSKLGASSSVKPIPDPSGCFSSYTKMHPVAYTVQ